MHHRKTLIAIAIAAVAAGAVALLAPGRTHADSSATFASGSAQLVYHDDAVPGGRIVDHVSFTAHAQPGGDPSGTIVLHSSAPPFESVKADVTCVTVIGKSVRVGGVIREPFEAFGGTIYALAITAVDSGPPGATTDLADDYALFSQPGRNGQTPCLLPLPPPATPVEQGNIVVDGHEGAGARVIG